MFKLHSSVIVPLLAAFLIPALSLNAQNQDPMDLLGVAEQKLQSGEYDDALSAAKQGTELLRKSGATNSIPYLRGVSILAGLQEQKGQRREAVANYWRALRLIRGMGDGKEFYPDRLTVLSSIAKLQRELGQLEAAEITLKQAVALCRADEAALQVELATALSERGNVRRELGKYREAEADYNRALMLDAARVGTNHVDYAATLNNLAILHKTEGSYRKAQPLYPQVNRIIAAAYGNDHPEYASALQSQAMFYYEIGDVQRALPLFDQILKIRKEYQGEAHPHYAQSLIAQAELLRSAERTEDAIANYAAAIPVLTNHYGKNHAACAQAYNAKGLALLDAERLDLAERSLREAEKIWQALGRTNDVEFATTLNNLGVLYLERENYEAARANIQSALRLRQKLLSPTHPETARSLNNLALLQIRTKEYAAALQNSLTALHLLRTNLNLTYSVLSERQQLVASELDRRTFNIFLRAARAANRPPENVYAEVMQWKGAVAARQIWQRRRIADRAEWKQLQNVRQQLANLVLRTASTSESGRRLQVRKSALERQREALETKLAREAGSDVSDLKRMTPQDLKALLPTGSALIDFVVHNERLKDGSGSWTWRERLSVFVVHPSNPIGWHDLGDADDINDSIAKWRRAIDPELGGIDSEKKFGKALRSRLWVPFAKHLEDCEIVFICSDGAVGKVPFGGLPGQEPDSYMIEERGFVSIPIVQMLRDYLVAPTVLTSKEKLLLIGGIYYDKDPGESVPNAPDSLSFLKRTPDRFKTEIVTTTAGEIAMIKDLFEYAVEEEVIEDGDVKRLSRSRATESNFREEAENSRWIHIATHGFSEQRDVVVKGINEVGSALQGYYYNCGLAMTGANTADLDPGKDDGILRGGEIAALDLRGVDLVVLSACETGLGADVKGEGLLGLQRAFQVSGARSVVASLWLVEDKWTRALMEEFYKTFWSDEKENRLPKYRALRKAQLAIMKAATRGVATIETGPTPSRAKASPYYWAAFIMSGAWE